jgi:hypothetical protein
MRHIILCSQDEILCERRAHVCAASRQLGGSRCMNIPRQSADEAIGHSPVVSVSVLPYTRPVSVGIHRPEAAATDTILLGDNRQFRDGSIIRSRRWRKVYRGSLLKPFAYAKRRGQSELRVGDYGSHRHDWSYLDRCRLWPALIPIGAREMLPHASAPDAIVRRIFLLNFCSRSVFPGPDDSWL